VELDVQADESAAMSASTDSAAKHQNRLKKAKPLLDTMT